jgi:hypothetical protein
MSFGATSPTTRGGSDNFPAMGINRAIKINPQKSRKINPRKK